MKCETCKYWSLPLVDKLNQNYIDNGHPELVITDGRRMCSVFSSFRLLTSKDTSCVEYKELQNAD